MNKVSSEILQSHADSPRGRVVRVLLVLSYPDGSTLAVPINTIGIESMLLMPMRDPWSDGLSAFFEDLFMSLDPKIRISSQERLKTLHIKVTERQADQLYKIATNHRTTTQNILTAFVKFALNTYNSGKSVHVWAEGSEEMKEFRKDLKVGDQIIASGIIGRIRKLDDILVHVEVAPNVVLEILREVVTDTLT